MTSSGSGSGGDSTTTNVPWAGFQPFLKEALGEASDFYNAGQLSPVAPESGYSQTAREQGANAALGGGFGVNQGAIGLANQTLGGDFLDPSNSGLSDAISYAQQPVIDAFNEQVAPGIDATFAGTAGGIGSGAYASQRNRAEDTLSRNLAGAATQAGYQNYGDERNRMMQSMGLAPGLENAGYSSFDRLGQYGQQETQRGQYEAEAPMRGLQNYFNMINSTPQFGTSTTQQDNGGGIDPFGAGLGGLLTLGGLFACDIRLKTDIERIGKLDTGEGLYRFRYKADPSKIHIGPMAQELEKTRPETVVEIDGVKMVAVEAL